MFWATNICRRKLGQILASLAITGTVRSLFGMEQSSVPSQNATAGASDSPEDGKSAEESAPTRPRLREGTKLFDLIGTVRQTGRRYTFFVAANSNRLVLLENLMLERILRAQASHVVTIQWKISGTVTEFQGQNYLIIEHALLHASTQEEPKPKLP